MVDACAAHAHALSSTPVDPHIGVIPLLTVAPAAFHPRAYT